VLEPWLYGSHTGISPVGIFAAAAFWTWLWGPIGLVVSMPLTVVVVVLGRYVPQLTFVNVLLSAQPALELGTRFYQRLLAFDDHEAAELVQTFLQTGGVDELYDTMVLPALSMSERDRIEDHLSERQLRFIHRAIRRLIGELKDHATAAAAPLATAGGGGTPAAPPRVAHPLRVLCLPAEETADRLAGQIVAQRLAARGHDALALPVRPTARSAPDQIEQREPDCVVISALAPGGAAAARDGCKLLRSRFPHLRLVVGPWGASADLDRLKPRLQSAGADFVTASLIEALSHLQQTAEAAPDGKAPADASAGLQAGAS
jgi:methylmalonyl-CoA mutase cobalamin-binding subunit